MSDYKPLKSADLKQFDGESTALVMEMVEAGWTGRISQRGHAIMHAPDGEATHSISRDSLRGRSGRNARATFERWMKQRSRELHPAQGETVVIEEAPQRDNIIQMHPTGFETFDRREHEPFACTVEDCGRTFSTAQGLAAHSKAHNSFVTCPFCGQDDIKVMGQHRRWQHPDLVTCPDCNWIGKSLGIHRGRMHPRPVEEPVEEELPQTEPITLPELTPPSEPVEIRPVEAMEYLLDVLGELERLRTENAALRAALREHE